MHKYIIATIKDWNIKQYYRSVYKNRKNWHLITDANKLTIAYIKSIKPKYIFFPHWRKKVNSKIKEMQTFKDEARPDPHPRSPEVLMSLAKVRESESGFFFAESFMIQKIFEH